MGIVGGVGRFERNDRRTGLRWLPRGSVFAKTVERVIDLTDDAGRRSFGVCEEQGCGTGLD
jgi:hypothetical protein